MPSRPLIPRISVNSLDSSPSGLSPSGTLDIKDVLAQAKLLPKLTAEDSVFGDAEVALYFEDGCLPSFPTRRHPPLFILCSHRAQLPFPLRLGAFEMDDVFWDEEDTRPLLTIPTVPRMKRMIKEQLFVQKWVDALTPDNPPRHIPWTCEKPTMKRKWVAEGSIFPADVVKTGRPSKYSCVATIDELPALVDQELNSRELCALSEAIVPIRAIVGSHTLMPSVRTKSADDSPGIFRGGSKTSQTLLRPVRTSQATLSPTSLPSVSSIGTTSRTPQAPLAARRGKTLSALNLQDCVIERLEYPDIPTAFRGSSTIWSPQFGTFPIPHFTDHESMLFDLKSKCATLGSGLSAYIQESLPPQTGLTRASLNTDEWAFTRGLTMFDNNFLGSVDKQFPKGITADMGIFFPSTSVKGPGFTARLGFVPHCHSSPAQTPPGKRTSDPPGDPLPPRPALINPLTPPHVRGILKKVKSVRFEDMTLRKSENLTSLAALPPQAPPERFSRPTLVTPSVRPCTPTPITKPLTGPTATKGALRSKSAPGSRLSPDRAKTNEIYVPTSSKVGNAPEPTKLTSVPVRRPCRIAHAKQNTNPTAVPQAPAKQIGTPITEIDVRKGIEGTTKSRLSTPLRNIFRFK